MIFCALKPLIEVDSGAKCIKMVWNNMIKVVFKDHNKMIYTETFLNYPYWTTLFTVHTDTSKKELGSIIGQYNKLIGFSSITVNQ